VHENPCLHSWIFLNPQTLLGSHPRLIDCYADINLGFCQFFDEDTSSEIFQHTFSFINSEVIDLFVWKTLLFSHASYATPSFMICRLRYLWSAGQKHLTQQVFLGFSHCANFASITCCVFFVFMCAIIFSCC